MKKTTRDIRYIDKDFSNFRSDLINFSKTYFPSTYNDFTPESTGMLFMEMASYLGDVLSFYLDNQIQETYLQYARQKENLFRLAYTLGYKPKVTTAANVEMSFYQQVPAITSGGVTSPDYSYCLLVPENTTVNSPTNTNASFIIQDKIDFSYSSSLDPTEVSVYQISGNTPTFYLLKKKRNAISAKINTTTFTFTTPERFTTININDSNIIGILDIKDSQGNTWYEVPNLAQDNVYDSIANTNTNDPNFSVDQNVPYLLKLKSVQRRFVSRFTNDTTLQLQFGAGTLPYNNDEEIVPNPDNVGLGLPFEKDKLTTAFSPLNFIFTDSYGIAPYNTTLTVRYLTGGGLQSNVAANTLTGITTTNVKFLNSNLPNNASTQAIFNSIAVTNEAAASGGRDGDTIEEIRQNSMGTFQTQLRAVTSDDYVIRALSMPSEFGSISKAYAEPEKLSNLQLGEVPSVINLYVLSYDYNKNLTQPTLALKQNLKTYLAQYRIINDSVKIKDAYIINIGVDFEIVVLPNYVNTEVISNCITTLTDFFNIDKWQINQPILLKQLFILLDGVEGVQTVKSVKVYNKTGAALGYSDYAYDVEGATLNNVVYPSIDPMIFEVKYPSVDIKGRVVPL